MNSISLKGLIGISLKKAKSNSIFKEILKKFYLWRARVASENAYVEDMKAKEADLNEKYYSKLHMHYLCKARDV